MRSPDRLTPFYAEVAKLHAEYLPDWRVGQFWYNFIAWMQTEKDKDVFFPEDDKLMGYLKEFVETYSSYKRTEQ